MFDLYYRVYIDGKLFARLNEIKPEVNKMTKAEIHGLMNTKYKDATIVETEYNFAEPKHRKDGE